MVETMKLYTLDLMWCGGLSVMAASREEAWALISAESPGIPDIGHFSVRKPTIDDLVESEPGVVVRFHGDE